MEDFYANCDYSISTIIQLPFVNNPLSDYDTIFTVLVQAAEQNKQNNSGQICFVTFDQPLYQKARYILSCVDPEHDPHGLSVIRVRLGGFHTLMSFLTTIGFIMNRSGLKQAFYMIYAENSAEKAFVGHAYSRAIRAHFLVQIALATVMFELLQLTEEKGIFDALLLNVVAENFQEDMQKEEFTIIRDRFIKQIEEFRKRGPTALLWIQYWDMLAIVKNFIKAERSGNWDLHLKCIEQMIPYFHASGHNNYAKSAHLYLYGKGIAPSTTVQKAIGAVIDDTCTVFDDGSVLLFGELSSLSLTTRVPCFFRYMRIVDDDEHAPRLFRCIHCACSGRVIKFFFDF